MVKMNVQSNRPSRRGNKNRVLNSHDVSDLEKRSGSKLEGHQLLATAPQHPSPCDPLSSTQGAHAKVQQTNCCKPAGDNGKRRVVAQA